MTTTPPTDLRQQPTQPESGEVRTRTFWSPCRKYLITAVVDAGGITLIDDDGAIYEATGSEQTVPAQPDGGEVVEAVGYENDDGTLYGYANHKAYERNPGAIPVRIMRAADFDRLQSALTEAQKDRNAQYDRAQTVSRHNSRLWSEREALRDQLTAAQQRIAYCIDLFDAQGDFDKAAPIEALVRSALSTIKRLKIDLKNEQARALLAAVSRDFPEGNGNG